jgi:hypothetical protein
MTFSFTAKGTRAEVLASLTAIPAGTGGPEGQAALDLVLMFMNNAPATDVVCYTVTAYGHLDPLQVTLPSISIYLTCTGMPGPGPKPG